MNEIDPRSRVISVFNLVAAGYDDPALRFFPFCADRLVGRINPAPGSRVLDVATGTGVVALAAAQAVGQQGRVMAIDLAESMLDRLQEKVEKFGVRNIDLHVMDANSLDFRRDYFDYVICSFGIFLLPDMVAGIREWARVLKPGGRVMFTAFGKRAFQPMMERLLTRLEHHGFMSADEKTTMASIRLAEPERCRELLFQAGFKEIEVTTEQVGYHLKDESQWWDVLWNSGMRGRLELIPPAEREDLMTQHLTELQPLMTEKGLWLDVETHFAAGTKP
ncbi:MAG: class I SAM-dependent methyltransferase [Gammaproteobacteria bacterium]|nr:class I SAM-dependent methyltransferase [Gammaproteobacteria bacterium]MDH3370714.1 class I SAM-dependent methyltransferase [Gammaproteobacteria bacterium]MDH3405983.1 class I SAM-dependent methyltransferase [Gammaproteobacteria bacterium]MDH3562497.1 class I SAM-dependent methyltransferase [Gammaproteobacteria bacterium]MDH5486186.1 class I SAM-dependent methyltransferase [Gammaproteobacteria bacterium]